MSATVRWRPAAVCGVALSVDAPANLQNIFGEWQLGMSTDADKFHLGCEDIPTLRALLAAGVEAEAVRALLRAIEKYDPIVVSWEY